MAAVPTAHPLPKRKSITAQKLKQQTMLLPGSGHGFRDHKFEACPDFGRTSSDAKGIRKSFDGSSLETIEHMVAWGMGVTVAPRLTMDPEAQRHVPYCPFAPPVPMRRVALAWCRSFTRYAAIAALRNAVDARKLGGVKRLS